MPAKPHIEEKKDQILAICEKYLKSEGFQQDNCKFSDYGLNIHLPNKRLIIIYFKNEKEISQKPPKVVSDNGAPLPREIASKLSNELWGLYPSPISIMLEQESNTSLSPQQEYLSQKWYTSFRDLAQEPYIDISPFVKLLKADYLTIYKTPLDIPQEQETSFVFMEKIFLEQIVRER